MLAFACLPALALPSVDEAPATGARAEDEAAVVIGIEDYFVLPDVPHARRDADAFQDFLVRTRGIPADRIRRLDRANREQILAALDELGAGVVWVYFAGHGAASPSTGERVLLGVDTQPDLATFEARAVTVAEIRERASRGGTAVLVLDTCYSGIGRSGVDLLGGKRFALPEHAIEAPGVVEWTAAGPGEWSGTLESAGHGAFTWAVLGALRGWADSDGNGTVTVSEASDYVGRALPALGVTDQHPRVQGAGDFVLSTASEPAPALAPEPLADARPAVAAQPEATGGTTLGVVSGVAEPEVLELNLARELDRLIDKGWAVDAVRFEAQGSGFGPVTSGRGKAWVTCGGQTHAIVMPGIGGTGTWSYRARTLAKQIRREAPCE